jgi:peptide/nickel transport system substrate-binding protein
MIRRLAPLALALLLTAACGPKTDTPAAPGAAAAKDVTAVRISQGSDALSMDPYAHNESPTFCVHRNIFDPLTDFDADLKLVPCLAESWTAETPTRWLFRLRTGVRFHEGQPSRPPTPPSRSTAPA